MENQNTVEDIVSMLDGFVSRGGGHMNITVNDNGNVNAEETVEKIVVEMKSSDCASGNLACNVPTLHEGIDD